MPVSQTDVGLRSDVEKLFDLVVYRIISLISEQLERVAKEDEGQQRINVSFAAHMLGISLTRTQRLILIGGFGDSDYLFTKVQKWCDSRDIQVLCPPDPYVLLPLIQGVGYSLMRFS